MKTRILIKNELNKAWLEYGKPWLVHYSSLQEIEKLFLEERYSPIVAVAIYIYSVKKVMRSA